MLLRHTGVEDPAFYLQLADLPQHRTDRLDEVANALRTPDTDPGGMDARPRSRPYVSSRSRTRSDGRHASSVASVIRVSQTLIAARQNTKAGTRLPWWVVRSDPVGKHSPSGFATPP